MTDRPETGNADEWQMWLIRYHGCEKSFLAVQICEALDAAKKDLLSALKGIVEDDDASVSLKDQRARWDDRMSAARAAIAKAEGTE